MQVEVQSQKKKKLRFRCDGDVGSQITSGRASAEQNHASWDVDKLRRMCRSPNLMATDRLPRDDKLVAAVAESPQNVLAGGPEENMGRPMGYSHRCSLARFAAQGRAIVETCVIEPAKRSAYDIKM